MKKLLSLIAVASVFMACRPETIGDVPHSGTPVIAAMAGTWKLTKVTVTDVESINKNSPFITKDVTALFPYTDFTVTLNANGAAPSTFAVAKGNAPAIIELTGGNWKVDNEEAPTQIQFINGNDTVRSSLGAYPTSFSNTFRIRVDKRAVANGPVINAYEYTFTKQ